MKTGDKLATCLMITSGTTTVSVMTDLLCCLWFLPRAYLQSGVLRGGGGGEGGWAGTVQAEVR